MFHSFSRKLLKLDFEYDYTTKIVNLFLTIVCLTNLQNWKIGGPVSKHFFFQNIIHSIFLHRY